MAEKNYVNFKVGTSAQYKAANKDLNAVYFLTDTHQLFKGEDEYSSSVIYVTSKPATGVEGKLYLVNGTVGYTYSETDSEWTEVFDLSKKANLAGATFTGSVILKGNPTEANEAATKAYVDSQAAAVDAMRFKGVVSNTSGLPTSSVRVGDTYKVSVAGEYAGVQCEVGDMIIAVKSVEADAGNDTWSVIQANIDGAVTGPASATENNVAIFSGSTGKIIKDSSVKIGGAAFEDDPASTTIATEAGVEAYVGDELEDLETSLKSYADGKAAEEAATVKQEIESTLEDDYVDNTTLATTKTNLEKYTDDAIEAAKMVWTSI